ncbi:hypothetical protein [Ferrovibrio terrae]|uniref:hypothetical protein n=1 Tax=Ferrovibrio terrae TaxID=2594003 RepID=UPI0031377D55
MLRYGLVVTGQDEQVLVLVDEAGLASLRGVLFAFSQASSNTSLSLPDEKPANGDTSISLCLSEQARGMQRETASGQLQWYLTREQARHFWELLSELTDGYHQYLECGHVDEIVVKVSRGEYGDDSILTAG